MMEIRSTHNKHRRRNPAHPDDLHELVHRGLAGEEGLTDEDLGEHAAGGAWVIDTRVRAFSGGAWRGGGWGPSR